MMKAESHSRIHLETERLRLREFVSEDWQATLAYQSDPLYLRYYPWNERTTIDARSLVEMFCDWQAERPRTRFQLALELKETSLLIGNCGIRINNITFGEADIGYEIDSRYWGRGLATEAAREILRFGFVELGLHRIWAVAVADNLGSTRVMEKLGMRLEAREREKEWIKGRWYDSVTYAILDHEWEEAGA
jgi:RimJ/RimL family protein N-acetyltransferase